MNRRHFICGTAALTGIVLPSLILTSSRHVWASPPIALNLLGWLGRFASSVAVGATTKVIADYVTNYLTGSHREPQVERVNGEMRAGGFTDLSSSKVYERDSDFFYAALRPNGKDACVPFFSSKRVEQVPMLEGASIIGLAHAANKLKQEKGSERAREALLPIEPISRSIGNFAEGYTKPDRYRTKLGSTFINYSKISPDVGKIAIISSSRYGDTIFDDEIEIKIG